MHEPGAASEQPGDTAQRGRQHGCATDAILVGTLMVIGLVFFLPDNTLLAPGQSPRWPLAFGATSYAVAILAALLARVVSTLSPWWLRLLLVSVQVSLLLWPTFVGSLCIVVGLLHLAGSHWDRYAAVALALPLYAVVTFSLWAYARRTVVHR